jgi:anti-anti-sigma factor
MELRDRVAEFVVVAGRPTIRGECDASNAASLRTWLAQFGQRPIEVDLGELTFLDAAAVDALLVAVIRNPHLRIVNPSPTVRRIITMSRTEGLLGTLRATRDESQIG